MKFSGLIILLCCTVHCSDYAQNNDENIGIKTLSKISTKNQIFSDSNYFPLHINNCWQYIDCILDDDGPSFNLSWVSVTTDTIISNKHYYKIDGIFSDLVRYSATERKLFIRWNDTDYVNVDFNIPDGLPFQSFSDGGFRTVYAETGEDSIFGLLRSYRGYIYIIPYQWGTNPLFIDSIGLYYCRTAATHGGVTNNIIAAVIYDSMSHIINYTDHKSPTFQITPIREISTQTFNLDFNILHPYTRILGGNPPPWHHGLDFIDSVKMNGYYSKNDSIINISDVVPAHIIEPVNTEFNVSIQLDTILLKNGFSFNYQFWAKDKCIIPEKAFSPDTGFYVCVWKEPNRILEEKYLSPDKFLLLQNYPNPFNPVTNLSFVISHPSFVSLKVYDVLGNEMATLVNEEKPAGSYIIEFNGSNFASGIYFYQLRAGSFTATKKLILLK